MYKKAFTLIELLVVIAVIALLMAVIVPALGKAKEAAKKIVCRNNIRQQCLGTMMYADENDSMVPTAAAGSWLWDISFWTTNQISQFAGFDDNDVFFCPANRNITPDDARYWQFDWVIDQPGLFGSNLFEAVPLQDESVLTISQQKTYWRSMPNLYMFDKKDASGHSLLPQTLESGRNASWIDKLNRLPNTGTTIMIMDSIVSQSNDWKFFDIEYGWMWQNFQEVVGSNHRSRQMAGIPPEQGSKPAGANIGYADGHVDWRNTGNYVGPGQFEGIQLQINYGQLFWW